MKKLIKLFTVSVLILTMCVSFPLGILRAEAASATTNSYEPSGFKFSGKIILIGDSTVCDYNTTYTTEYNRYGWGMKLGSYFKNVKVQNLAIGGLSARTFYDFNNHSQYNKLVNGLSKGDYLFIQFGHNDECRTPETADRATYTKNQLTSQKLDSQGKNAQGQYSYEFFLTKYINLAKSKGAIPVLVTPIAVRNTNGDAYIEKHKPFQQAMIALGKELNVPVMDMTSKTAAVYNNLYKKGKGEETKKYHCKDVNDKSKLDIVHLSSAGADMVASLIAKETKNLGLTLSKSLKTTSNNNNEDNTNNKSSYIDWGSYEPSGFKFSNKIYIVGDSTVATSSSSDAKTYDRYGWGMKLADQYKNATVTNLACGGASSRNFINTSSYETLKKSLGKGDYLFIQFGHCDMTSGRDTVTGLDQSKLDKDGKNAQGQYSFEFYLMKYYVDMARKKGAVPVLVTPITYRKADGTASYGGLTNYQNAMIKLGKEYHIPVIDMTAATIKLCKDSSAATSAKYYAYADTAKKTRETMHLSSTGATKVASLIAQDTKKLGLTLSKNLR